MAKQIETPAVFNVIAYLASVLFVSDKRGLATFIADNVATIATGETVASPELVDIVFADVLSRNGLVAVDLSPAKITNENVIVPVGSAQSIEVNGKRPDRWFKQIELTSFLDMPNNSVRVICKRNYLVGKIVGFEAAATSTKALPKVTLK